MKAYVVGGSGYTGRELIRILESHPKVEEVKVSSTRFSGKKVSDVHKTLTTSLVFEEFNASSANSCDVAFCCVPHTKAMEIVSELETKVIDLSADFRLKDVSVYEKFYGVKHSNPKLVENAVYGLPEYYRKEIKDARIVANPGCYPTAVVLAVRPLIESFDVQSVIADAKSGVSGAGMVKEDEYQKFVGDENFKAYKLTTHQHAPEIDQEVGFPVFFTPHLAPFDQGIFTTIHALTLANPQEVKRCYEEKYKDEPFVKLVKEPDVASVRNTNMCQIGGFESDGKRCVITSAIDNLVKGASGQAVQNMNLMFGFKETIGLV